jgi:hypothetical protein
MEGAKGGLRCCILRPAALGKFNRPFGTSRGSPPDPLDVLDHPSVDADHCSRNIRGRIAC